MRVLSHLVFVGFVLLAGCSSSPSQVEKWEAGVEEIRARGSQDAPWMGRGSARTAFARASIAAPGPIYAVYGNGAGETYIFNVGDLVNGIRDFAGPEIGDLRHPNDRPDYDEDRVGERVPFVDSDVLEDLVRAQLAGRIDDADDISITVENGKLIVHREP